MCRHRDEILGVERFACQAQGADVDNSMRNDHIAGVLQAELRFVRTV